MGLRPTHRDESPAVRPTHSKWVICDFRRSVIAIYCQPLPGPSSQNVYRRVSALFVIRLDLQNLSSQRIDHVCTSVPTSNYAACAFSNGDKGQHHRFPAFVDSGNSQLGGI